MDLSHTWQPTLIYLPSKFPRLFFTLYSLTSVFPCRTYNPPAKGYRPPLFSADGGVISTVPNSNLNLESNLDLQYAIGLTWPNGVDLYQVGDTIESASFNQFLDAV